MKSKVKAMENFVAGWDIWLVSSMCLVTSYLWSRLCDLLCYKRRRRASSPPAIQVYSRMFDLLNNAPTLTEEHWHTVFFVFYVEYSKNINLTAEPWYFTISFCMDY